MADTYGGLIFSKSQDCVYDAQALKRKLNGYKWSSGFQHWEYTKEWDNFYSKERVSQYPTVYPDVILSVHVMDDDGNEQQKSYKDLTEDELELIDQFECDLEEADLDNLCLDISEALSAGWIEIGLTANHANHYAHFQSLHILSNGQGKRQYVSTGDSPDKVNRIEYTENFRYL